MNVTSILLLLIASLNKFPGETSRWPSANTAFCGER